MRYLADFGNKLWETPIWVRPVLQYSDIGDIVRPTTEGSTAADECFHPGPSWVYVQRWECSALKWTYLVLQGTNIVSQMCTTEVFVVVNVVFIALHDLYSVPTWSVCTFTYLYIYTYTYIYIYIYIVCTLVCACKDGRRSAILQETAVREWPEGLWQDPWCRVALFGMVDWRWSWRVICKNC